MCFLILKFLSLVQKDQFNVVKNLQVVHTYVQSTPCNYIFQDFQLLSLLVAVSVLPAKGHQGHT